MYEVIYKITNNLNDKSYVGQTKQPLKNRIAQHRYHDDLYIDRAIRKYGWENFFVEILEECETQEKLNEREKFWIAKFNTKCPNGYNLTDGGEGMPGFSHSSKSIAKMSDTAKEIWACRLPEERAAIAKKREANRSPEERAATARARELAKPCEERSARRKKSWANKSPEERSAIVKKAWVTRRANDSKKTPEERMATTKSSEERSAITKKAAAKVDKTTRNAKISATWKSKTPKELGVIVEKRLATIQAKKKQKLICQLIELLKNVL